MKHGILTTSVAALALAMSLGSMNAADWEGGYIGIGGGATSSLSTKLAGVKAGYNFGLGTDMVAGAEISGVFSITSGTGIIIGQGRLGYKVTSDFMVFGTAGVGTRTSGGSALWSVGVGGEYAINNRISIRADYNRFGTFGGGGSGAIIMTGVSYNF